MSRPRLGDHDFWPADRLAAFRARRWRKQRAHLEANSAFYKRLWAGRRPPARLDDLAALPLTTKAMLRDSQAARPPFGDYLATPPERVMRLHRTSGTSGRPLNIALSAADAAMFATASGRAMQAAGLGPGHLVVHCLNYQLWMGGYTDHATLEATGATVVPFGVGDSEHLIRTIRELGITAIYCTPSYPAVLEKVVAEHFEGLAPADLGLELALLAGEPGLENQSFRDRIETTWRLAARNLYGISDVLTTVPVECAHNAGLHVVTLDALHAELVAPDGDAPIDWAAGATGELVLTHLKRECQPLVRFRTGDIVTVTATEPCACGRTAPRIRIVGRADDMVVVRGVNVFPGDVAAVVTRFAELSGEFRIRLRGPAPYHRLPVEAELAPGNAAAPALADALAEAIKQATRASAEVTLLAPFELPRSAGKTRRVFREDRS